MCGKCSGEKSKTEIFVEKARKVHGDRYDYSNIEYIRSDLHVEFFCESHGVFKQSPHSHLKGYGCRLCGLESMVKSRTSSSQEFVRKAIGVHGRKYDYSLVFYVGAHKNVVIRCHEHGEFSQAPAMHLRGRGCPSCGGRCKLSKESFELRARSIHGDRYDYSMSKYCRIDEKLIITCPEHGAFLQRPISHLNGKGCRFCAASKGERKVRLYLASKGVSYTEQFMFKVSGKFLFCDFLCGEQNTIFEYDGEFHYTSHWRSGCGGLKNQKKNDRLKDSWAKANGYRMVRIPYWAHDKIEEIVEAALRGEKPKIPRRPRVGKTGSSGKKRSRTGRKSCV